jgi:hypothetical protein
MFDLSGIPCKCFQIPAACFRSGQCAAAPAWHRLTAPFIEEFSGPGGGVVIPELLKGFLEKASADGAEDVAKPEAPFGLPIFLTLQQFR